MPVVSATGAEACERPASPSDLFWSFSFIALQGFGGVLAVIQRELVDRKRWLTHEQFIEEWAVAQILPGPNVVNISLMIGGRHFGLKGALAAMAGMLFFPFLIVMALGILFTGVAGSPLAQGALRGMGAVAGGLITATGAKLMIGLRTNVMGPIACGLFAAATFVCIVFLRWPLLWVLLAVGGSALAWAYVRLIALEAQRLPEDKSAGGA